MAESRYLYFEPDKVGKLKNLNLLVRQAVEGFISGLHRSPHRGFSVEFSEHREYSPGDDLRHLDWIAWARSDRYYIKQYEQETNLRAHILLDVSGSMGFRLGDGPTKLQYGCFLVACLSYLMCRQQDVVGMVAFDEKVRFKLPPASAAAHLDRIFRYLSNTQPGRGTAVASTFHDLAMSIDRRGLVIVVSDLHDDPDQIVRALQHFAYKKHQIIVFHVLDEAELSFPFRGMKTFIDMETGNRLQVDAGRIRDTYLREMKDLTDFLRKECSDRKIEYVLAPTNAPYDHMLLQYLSRRKVALR